MSTTNGTSVATPKVGKYGDVQKTWCLIVRALNSHPASTVRLGNSGLKVSRIILGPLSHMRVNLRLAEVLTGGK